MGRVAEIGPRVTPRRIVRLNGVHVSEAPSSIELSEGERWWTGALSYRYSPYVLLLFAYWASARLLGVRPEIGTSVTSVLGFGILPHLLALYLMSRVVLVTVIRSRTFRAARDGLRRDLLRVETLERLAGIPLFVLGTVFMFDVFGAFKEAIPRFSPYGWDETFAAIDAFVHGGVDPWVWTHSVLGPSGTQILDQIYLSWFSVLILWILVTATWAPLALRARFFLSLVLTCALAGSLAATVFASGGPVYFGELAGDSERFLPLVESLTGTVAQQNHVALWEAFATKSDKLYGGISAMPSMHVTLTALMAMAAFAWHPVAGAVGGLYTVLILMGSVHLAWHYAIDGYAGVALAALIWVAVGRFTPADAVREGGAVVPRYDTRETERPAPLARAHSSR